MLNFCGELWLFGCVVVSKIELCVDYQLRLLCMGLRKEKHLSILLTHWQNLKIWSFEVFPGTNLYSMAVRWFYISSCNRQHNQTGIALPFSSELHHILNTGQWHSDGANRALYQASLGGLMPVSQAASFVKVGRSTRSRAIIPIDCLTDHSLSTGLLKSVEYNSVIKTEATIKEYICQFPLFVLELLLPFNTQPSMAHPSNPTILLVHLHPSLQW